jgi:hypothetical protein
MSSHTLPILAAAVAGTFKISLAGRSRRVPMHNRFVRGDGSGTVLQSHIKLEKKR